MKYLNKFTFTPMNYRVGKTLDSIVNKIMESKDEIEKIDYSEYYILITFKCGGYCRLWDKNKYYGWLSTGVYYKNELLYNWDDQRPYRETMARFLVFIENYSLEKLKL